MNKENQKTGELEMRAQITRSQIVEDGKVNVTWNDNTNFIFINRTGIQFFASSGTADLTDDELNRRITVSTTSAKVTMQGCGVRS